MSECKQHKHHHFSLYRHGLTPSLNAILACVLQLFTHDCGCLQITSYPPLLTPCCRDYIYFFVSIYTKTLRSNISKKARDRSPVIGCRQSGQVAPDFTKLSFSHCSPRSIFIGIAIADRLSPSLIVAITHRCLCSPLAILTIADAHVAIAHRLLWPSLSSLTVVIVVYATVL